MRIPRGGALPLLLGVFACADSTGPADPGRCVSGGVLEMSEGDVFTGSVGSLSVICLRSSSTAEYALIPFVGEERDTLLRAEVLIESGSFLSDSTPFVAARALLDGSGPAASPGFSTVGTLTDESRVESAPFHERLRAEERRLLGASLARRREARSARVTSAAAAGPLTVPAEGSILELSVSAICDDPDMRSGRVVAVTQHAIVVEDTTNPPGGFTEAQLRSFGEEYESLVHPTVTDAFAEPTDIDDNGRVILFFTGGVNEKTPSGGAGVVAGYFWGGDLFPADGGGELAPCPSSNEGEILYLAVPDPTGSIGGRSVSLDLLLSVTTTTVGHELQHLVNSARRIHVNGAEILEETWLNEGLSLIAEELLFYAATGLEPRSNLDASRLQSSPAVTTAFNRFAEHNVGRYNLHLQIARTSSPLGRDGLATRGATWSFLRYAADRDPRPDETLFRALAEASTAGLANLEVALGADPLAWMADWGVSVLSDDLLPGTDERYRQPSWHMRSLVPALRPVDRRFPIQVLGLHGSGAFLIRLQTSGAVAYPVFRLGPGRSDIQLTPGDGTDEPIRYGLVRVD